MAKTKNKSKAVSWALSLIIHATGLVMILVAGFHIAAPEGSVTDKVEFDAVDSKPMQAAAAAPVQQPAEPAQPAPAPPAPQEASQPAPPQSAPPPPEEEAPPQETVDEAPPLKTQPDEQAPPAPTEVAKQEDPTADTAAEPTEAQNTNANPTPAESAPPAPPQPAQQIPVPAPVVAENQVPAGAPGTGAASTDSGATIDESKLIEAFGNHKPSYPYMSRLRRQQGTVVLRAFVNEQGVVSQVTVATSSGFSAIDEEARTTYERWKYQPGLTGWVIKPFKFSLK